MYSRGHWWNIKLPPPWGDVCSDDLTLDEVERLEALTDVPWSLSNPLASLKQAKAWLIVSALHAGASEADAVGLVEGPTRLNLAGIKGVFQLHDDSEPRRGLKLADEGVPEIPPSSAPTSAIG